MNTNPETLVTNELKKGDRVVLRNGWMATVMDNKKGNTRDCEVEGNYTEIGSVYSHDIMYKVMGTWRKEIAHTPAQLKLMAMTKAFSL